MAFESIFKIPYINFTILPVCHQKNNSNNQTRKHTVFLKYKSLFISKIIVETRVYYENELQFNYIFSPNRHIVDILEQSIFKVNPWPYL